MNLKRSKILYIMEYLSEKTDDDHGVTMAEILAMLKSHDISSDRKTVYEDLQILRDFGLDISANKGGGTCTYHLVSRDFELYELKILVDAVQVAKFISEKKTNELIRKLEKLTSERQAKELHRQVFVADRVKTVSDNFRFAIDALHTAINTGSQISFRYFNWDVKGAKAYRNGGAEYTVSPWALVWEDENYYLVAYHNGILKHFRVDKIEKVTLLKLPREGLEAFRASDYKHLSSSMFRMFGGDYMKVTLDCANDAAGIIIDQFGRDHLLSPTEGDRFHVTLPVYFSDQFISWLLALGDKVKLIYPEDAVRKVREFLKEKSELYK